MPEQVIHLLNISNASSECTLNVLRQARRFITTAAFDTDTIGLKKALEKGDICFCSFSYHLCSHSVQAHDERISH